ncbi:hypothetical protein GCM10009779_61260 [Polymorphospora rubra]|uniref:Uncharacterized protein n=1 Tax=Polymorphospora rubra TaxID=338584 RepID=A0A810MZQ2_9ACTN|nr:hypothetical protein Prubr_18890 [Polymorphospora rubra]
MVDRWPRLAAELATALREEGESDLVNQVDSLRVLRECGCGDDFCQSFYTQPPPAGAYGPGHRNIGLSPHRAGMLVLDVVDNVIMFVEVIDRPPLD